MPHAPLQPAQAGRNLREGVIVARKLVVAVAAVALEHAARTRQQDRRLPRGKLTPRLARGKPPRAAQQQKLLGLVVGYLGISEQQPPEV